MNFKHNYINKLKVIAYFLLLFISNIDAQQFTISGRIVDSSNVGLPFSSVQLNNTSQGSNANSEGYYSLSLPAGQYKLVYQLIGYKKHIENINLTSNINKIITLIPENYQLNEVLVSDGEDPAYAVIREAIKKRKFYLNEVEAYSCNAYIKGMQKLKNYNSKMVKLLNAMSGSAENKIDSTLLGIVYLSESETKYYFQQPNNERELMYSSKVSGKNNSFSFNKVSETKFNLYENLITLNNLSDRPIISPISENAFLSYRYKLLGTTFEDGKMINKIAVIPKRPTDPCFKGIIYIQENTWRVHSADVYLTKENKINFVDTLRMKVTNMPIGDSVWMTKSLHLSFNYKLMGFEGEGYFIAVFSEFDLHPIFPNGFFKKEALKINKLSNEKDSSYWAEHRPIPLTDDEIADYRKKDSLQKIRNSDRYMDSVDHVFNRIKLKSFLLGYNYSDTKNKLELHTSGLLSSGLQFNTVEGVNLSLNVNLIKKFIDKRRHTFNTTTRYGFSNKLAGATINWEYLHNPFTFGTISASAGSSATQFNSNEPIRADMNTFYSLLNNDNYLKLYKKTFATIGYKREIINGLIGFANAEYAERTSLKNTSNDIWRDDKSKLYTSNNPLKPLTDDSSFTTNNAFVIELGLSIRFKQKYDLRPYDKRIEGSKFPVLNIMYQKAIPGLNTLADYDLIKCSIDQYIKMGLLGTFAYKLKGGYFINSNSMSFMDYKHFNGNQTFLANNDYLNSFKLLPYYSNSTNKSYVEAHAEHHFNGFIFNKLPLLKKTRLQEVIGGHALYTSANTYYEVNFGIEHILQIIRVDYVMSYTNKSTFNQGFVVGIGFDL